MASAAVQAAVALRLYRVATSFSHAERKRSTSSLRRIPAEAHPDGAVGERRRRRPSPRAHASAGPCRTNRRSRTTPRRPRGRRRSAPSRRGCRGSRRRGCSAAAGVSRRIPPRRLRSGGKTGLGLSRTRAWERAGTAVAIAPGKLGRGAEADDPGDVLGAGPVAALLPAAADEAVADLDRVRGQDDRADALRAAELVRRQRQNIRPERLDVDREFCRRPGPRRRAGARR